MIETDEVADRPLFTGDTGALHELSRRALLEVLKGPYLSGRQRPQLWSALIADERAIRSQLHDLFLDLVIDPVDEFAFVRKVRSADLDVPSALRSERLNFLDTAMLLVLRQLLLASAGDARVIVGREEVLERLGVYRDGDESTFQRNLNGSWGRMMNKLRVIHPVDGDRAEISPVVKFIVDEERVAALTEVYRRIAGNVETDVEVDDVETAVDEDVEDEDVEAVTDEGEADEHEQAAIA